MRILFTADPEFPVPPFLYGGIERIVDSLIAEMRSRRHVVGLLAHPDSSAVVDWQAGWPGASSQRWPDTLANTRAMSRAIQDFKPDVVHSFSRIAYFGLSMLTRLPKVMSYQRDPSPRTTGWAARLAGQRLVFTGCSEHIAARGRPAGGEWYAISNFIDPGKLDFAAHVVPDAPLVFLSRIERVKGCHTAIAIAKASGRRLLIAGNRVETGSSTGYWDQEIAPHLGKNGIEYVGAVNDAQKNALLGHAAAMVVPIEWDEPFGIVFAEALACGTPIISCSRGALPEIVKNGIHGFLINNIEEGIHAVQRLKEISRAACRKQVDENYTVQVVAAKYLDLYDSMVSLR